MKLSGLLACSALLSALCLRPLCAAAQDDAGAYSSLQVQAQGLGLDEAALPAAPPAHPAWQAVPLETPGYDEQNFWDDLYSRVSKKDACEDISLPIEYGTDAQKLGSAAGSISRRFHRYPDGSLALIDEADLAFQLSAVKSLLSLGAAAGVSLTGGVSLAGSSMVIRPLGGAKACKELKQFAGALKYKTVLPLSAARFAAMQNGEIWKLPLTLWAGFSPAVTGRFGEVTVSFGVANQRLPSVSIARLSDKELRVRLRLDQARIVSAAASVGAGIAPVTVGLDGLSAALSTHLGKVVGGVVGYELAEEFAQYSYASLGLSLSQAKGRKVLLEFVLDPRSEEQMAALEALLKGGGLNLVGDLAKVALGVDFLPGHDSTTDEAELDKMQSAWSKKLGLPPAFSGQNGYRETDKGLAIHIPLIGDYGRTNGRDQQTVDVRGSGQVIHVNEDFRDVSRETLKLPFIEGVGGTLFKHNSHKLISVFNEETDGKVGEAAMVYQQFEGAIRHGSGEARRMLDEVNAVMRRVGTKGEEGDSRAAMPLGAIEPPRPASVAADDASGDEKTQRPGVYKAAFMTFTMMFDQDAVRDILTAPAGMIVKAFFNSLEDADSRDMMRKVLSVATVAEDGSIRYGQSAVQKALGAALDDLQENQDLMGQVSSFCRKASQIVADLIRVRAAPDWQARSALLAKVLAGQGKSKLKYADMLKVLVQVVDPKDVSGEMTYQTEKKKGGNDVSVHYSYNQDGTPSLSKVDRDKDALERFTDPSQLSD